MPKTRSRLGEIVRAHESEILGDWIALQKDSVTTRRDLMNDAELDRQSREFLNAFVRGTDAGNNDIHTPAWQPALEILSRVSQSRAIQGFSPSETATFVFSLKQPVFNQLRASVTD